MPDTVLAVLRRHLKSVWCQPWLLQRVAYYVWQTLRTEEVFGLRRYFLPQGQTDTEAYEQWVRIYDTLTDGDRSAIRQHLVRLPYKPLLSIVMPVYDTSEKLLRKAIASVRSQLYDNWELCIADDASTAQHVKTLLAEAKADDARIKVTYRETKGHISPASNSALALAIREYVVLLDHEDELTEHALYLVVAELNAHPHVTLVYSDEDKITEYGTNLTSSRIGIRIHSCARIW